LPTSLGLALSIVVLSAAALALSAMVLVRYRRERRACHLYWGIGLFLVFVTLAEEAALFVGVWSEVLVQSYLVLVAVLVGILSLGSAELSLHGWGKRAWFAYIAATSVLLAAVGFLYTVPSSIVVDGVVSGLPSTPVVIASSLVTFPAAGLLIVASLYGALREKRLQLLYITAGTVVISAAGSLYLVSFPLSLYYAEFVGVALLFLGFVKVPMLSIRGPHASPT
jgi:hypothetical protein